jgi:hypothetical protein
VIETRYISRCYLASCRVPERPLVLCNVAIWGHTVKDHHNFTYRLGTTPDLYKEAPHGHRRLNLPLPTQKAQGKEAIPDRVSHHFAEARIGRGRLCCLFDQPVASHGSNAKGRPPKDRSDKPTVRKGLAICRRTTIDRHHRHQLHWIRTGRTLSLLTGELSTAAPQVYASPAARTMAFNCRRSATGKSKMGREQVA